MATLADFARSLFRRSGATYQDTTVSQHFEMWPRSTAGVSVTEQTALSISTVYACIYKIASTIAGLGLEVYTRNGREVDLANVHPAYLVINTPNEENTAYEFWETIVASALMYGCGFAVIERDNRGYGTKMHLVHYSDVELRENNGQKYYKVHGYGVVMPENMLEICNMFRMSPIRLHRENMGLAKAAQDFGSEYFGQKGQMTGVLASDQPLRKEQMDVIQNSWNQSSMNAGTKLLPFGFRYQRITITPDEAQFIETRKFQAEEICRIFSVPASLVQLPSQTTYNNVEQQNLMFARHTIAPWAKRIEQEIDRKLIQSFERPDVYAKFSMNDLYRGDLNARANYYQQALQSGFMSINEVRAKENMNPIAEGGDEYLVQINQITASKIKEYSEKVSNDGAEPTA
jgi:HK97 family phage portal protein